MQFRKDICGLRGLAILMIMLFHAGMGVPGGYIGVDIFFVLSGYLIAGNLSRSHGEGSFSFAGFLKRKILRLAPPLYAMMAATWFFALPVLSPEHLLRLQKSLFAAVFFVSNFHFSSIAGYFDTASISKPLLHTWALGIEAQFYLLIGITFLLFRRKSIHILVCLVLAACSFLASVHLTGLHSSAAYYLPQSRLWVLAMGALLGLMGSKPVTSGLVRDLLRSAALLVLGYCALTYSFGTSYPGLLTLPVCLSGLVLIAVGPGDGSSASDRLLNTSVLQFLGRSSYGMYLWHWPLLVLVRIYIVREMAFYETGALLVLSVVLGYCSFLVFEQVQMRSLRVGFFRLSFCCMVALLVCSRAAVLQVGTQESGKDLVATVFAESRGGAGFVSAIQIFNEEARLLNDRSISPTFLLWGDSHASALIPAFKDIAVRHGMNGYAIVRNGCVSMIGTRKYDADEACTLLSSEMLSFILEQHIQRVYLASRWDVNVYGNIPLADSQTDMGAEGEDFIIEKRKTFSRSLQRTVRQLTENGVEVFIFDQPAKMEQDIGALQSPGLWPMEKRELLYKERGEVEQYYAFVTHKFENIAQSYPLHIIRTRDALCTDAYCPFDHDGKSMYRDDDHLSWTGVRQLIPVIEETFVVSNKN